MADMVVNLIFHPSPMQDDMKPNMLLKYPISWKSIQIYTILFVVSNDILKILQLCTSSRSTSICIGIFLLIRVW